MRKEAQEYMERMLQDLKFAGSSQPQYSNAGVATSSAIRKKLQNAVKMMQEGLVERDTEVSWAMVALLLCSSVAAKCVGSTLTPCARAGAVADACCLLR